METQKIRITAKTTVCRRYSVDFMGVKIAVAFNRDSGAKVGYKATHISGKIGSGGSRVNWYCYVDEGSIFELDVDKEFYEKNKNRIKNWEIQEIEVESVSKERSEALLKMEKYLE